MIGLCIPSPSGEVDAAYTAGVVQRLQPAWHYDYRFSGIGQSGYAPMLFDASVLDDAITVASQQHSTDWLMFNEPECREQGDTPPGSAASILRTWFSHGWSARMRVSVGGVNVSVHHGDRPYTWLNRLLYNMTPLENRRIGNWHIHAYGTVTAVDEALRLFERWMQRNKLVRPIVLSETASSEEPAGLMAALTDWLSSGRIAMAAWFSSYYSKWNETGLLDSDGNLTEIGQIWMKQQERHEVFLPQVTVAEGV